VAYNQIDLEVTARASTGEAESKLDRLRRDAERTAKDIEARKPKISADITQAELRIGRLEKALKETTDKDRRVQIQADIDSAKAKLIGLRREAERLDEKRVKIDVDADNKTIVPQVNAGPALAALRAIGIAMAAVAAGAAGGMLLGAGAALGGGLAAAAAGMTGIGAAVSAAGKSAAGSTGATRDYAAALHQVSAAQWDLKRAQRDEKDAAQAVHDARVQARRDLQDLARQTADMALSQEQATLDVQQAWEDYQYSLADPRGTTLQRQQAELAYREAKQRQADLAQDAKRLAEDKAAADRKGVDGADEVRQAEERLQDAHHQVADAVYQVAQAQKALTAGSGAAAGGVDALAKAMANLGPHGREFVTFMRGFIDGPLKQLRLAGQESFLPGVQAGLVAIEPAMRRLRGPFADMSKLAGEAVGHLIELGGKAAGPLLRFATEAMRDLKPLGPVLDDMVGALGRVLDKAVKSGDVKDLMDGFVDVVRALGKHLPDLVDGMLHLGKALGPPLAKALDTLVPLVVQMAVALGPALAQALTAVQPLLDDFAQWVKDHPKDFRDMVLVVAGLAGAIAGIAAVLPGVATAVAVLADPVGQVAVAVAAVGLAVGVAYDKFKPFRDMVNHVGVAFHKELEPRLKDAKKILHDELAPAIDRLKKTLHDNKPELDKMARAFKKITDLGEDFSAMLDGELAKGLAHFAAIIGGHFLDDLSTFVWLLSRAVDLAGKLGDMTGLSSVLGGGAPSHHAAGGVAGGLSWVGEAGPELVRLPYGSQVMSAGDSRRAVAGGGKGGGGHMMQLSVSDSEAGRLLVTLLQRAVKARGGDVLVTLGQRHA